MNQVTQYFMHLFSTEGFPPRWFCGVWTPFHGWLYILAELGIWSAYFTIPLALIYVVRKRSDVPFAKLFWLFAAFIFACGTTHFLDATMFWWPAYRLTGLVELATAIISWVTVFAIIQVIPKALLLKSPNQLEAVIQERTEALQKSEMRFRLLTEGVKDYSIYMEDTQGIITSWNKGAERIYGYEAEEVLGTPVTIFYTEEEIKTNLMQRKLKNALELGHFEMEAQRIRKDGSRFWASILLTAVYDEAGHHIGFSNISRDITQKKQAAAELKNLQDRLNRVIEGSDQGFWDWDLAHNQVYWSDRLYEMLGIPKRNTPMSYDLFETFLPEEEKPRINAAMDRTIKQGVPFDEDFRMRHASGVYLYFSSHGKPEYDMNGNLVHVSGMIADITERKEAEAALEDALQKLAQSNKDLEQFAAVASHDLKAPLRKVNLFSSIVEEERDKLSAEGQKALSRVRSSTESMLTLIDDLLAWSRVNYNSLLIRPVELYDVIQNVLATLKPVIQEKGAEIQVKRLHTVLADETQLEQLFQNLIENALKYQPQGQKPIIEIDSERFDHVFWQVTIQDNGIGFKPEYAEKIFEPFSRLHGKASNYPGSGVGLAICKRIVERHKGIIEARSRQGEGAQFIVRLPYDPTMVSQEQEDEIKHADID